MTKKKSETESEKEKKAGETWRKPLQVPPRTNAMRSFYQGDEGKTAKDEEKRENVDATAQKVGSGNRISKQKKPLQPLIEKKSGNEKPEKKKVAGKSSGVVKMDSELNSERVYLLTKKELTAHLGFDSQDLFDVHELLQGKSFDIYRSLLNACDETGRCKITQPELMSRTEIKNRRTFYKHEKRLLDLKILEKRHRPGDHRGIVYKVFKLSQVLPIPSELLKKFEQTITDE